MRELRRRSEDDKSSLFARSHATSERTVARLGVRVCTLGGLRVIAGGSLLPAPSDRALRLLSLLICLKDHSGHKEHLAEVLWPDNIRSRNNLHAAAHDLRAWIGDARMLGSDGGQYRLCSTSLDVDTLEGHYLKGVALRNTDLSTAVNEFGVVVDAYAGPFLPEFPYLDWVIKRRNQIELWFIEAAVVCAKRSLEATDFNYSLELADRILEINPAREDAARVRMRAFAGLGRRTEAIRFFEEFKTDLYSDLRCLPDPATQELRDQLGGDP